MTSRSGILTHVIQFHTNGCGLPALGNLNDPWSSQQRGHPAWSYWSGRDFPISLFPVCIFCSWKDWYIDCSGWGFLVKKIMMNKKLNLNLWKSCLGVLELAKIFLLHQAPEDVHIRFQDKNPAIMISHCKWFIPHLGPAECARGWGW